MTIRRRRDAAPLPRRVAGDRRTARAEFASLGELARRAAALIEINRTRTA